MLVSQENYHRFRHIIASHTLAWVAYDGPPPDGLFVEAGSGTAVTIAGRCFVFTVGHTLDELDFSTQLVTLYTEAIEGGATELRLMNAFAPALRCVNDYDSAFDIGVFEVPLDEAEEWSGIEFVEEDRLCVLSAQEVAESEDVFLISGYPGALHRFDGETREIRLLTVQSQVAGVGEAPNSKMSPAIPDGINVFEVWLPRDGMTNLETDSPIDLPALNGASGGGCWRLSLDPDIEPNAGASWDPDSVVFVASHMGSNHDPAREQTDAFAREISIGHHLRLLADAHPELSEHILSKWPEIRTWRGQS